MARTHWDERQHPRDPDGQFTEKPGGWVSRVYGLFDQHQVVRGGDVRDQFDSEQERPRIPRSSFAGTGDPVLGDIYAAQGFNGSPEVVSREEMDRRVAAGAPQMWRGISSHLDDDGTRRTGATLAEQYRSGPHFPGLGMFGNGTYASVDRDQTLGYLEYQGGYDYSNRTMPGQLRLSLRPEARVVDFDDLMEMMQADGLVRDQRELWGDPGRYAAARGYDAIAAQPRNENYRDGRIMYYVLLNRTAVVVQEAAQ